MLAERGFSNAERGKFIIYPPFFTNQKQSENQNVLLCTLS